MEGAACIDVSVWKTHRSIGGRVGLLGEGREGVGSGDTIRMRG
jgi:hypothetical protein